MTYMMISVLNSLSLLFVELCEYIICNYPREPHIAAATRPFTYLFAYISPLSIKWTTWFSMLLK